MLASARRRAAAGCLVAAVAVAVAASLSPWSTASARTLPADNPAGFWYGTDSNYIPIPGPAPYQEPVIGGSDGGYIGMIGNWAAWQGCHGRVVWSKTDARRAATNLASYDLGIGVGGYWFMAGPGVDPNYNGTSMEATAWGAEQAAVTLADIKKLSPALSYPVVFLDVELPGDAPSYTPAQDNGWNAVYTSPCSGVVRTDHVAASLDRADFDGFADYLTAHSSYKAGVYSAPGIWADIFGTGIQAAISNTYEWTYTDDTASLSDAPDGWCFAGTSTCADFFGGISRGSKYALMWQWSGGGGTYNGVGDFDQIDGNRTP